MSNVITFDPSKKKQSKNKGRRVDMFKIKHVAMLNGPLHECLGKLMQQPGQTEAVFNLMRLAARVRGWSRATI